MSLSIAHKPQIGLFLLVAIIYTNASEVGVRSLGLPSILQFLVVILLLVLVARRSGAHPDLRFCDPILLLAAAYGVWIFTSSAWAPNSDLSDGTLAETVKGLVIIFLSLNLLNSRERLVQTAWVLVGVGAFLGTITVFQALTSSYHLGFGGFGRIKMAQIVGSMWKPRTCGPLSDPNFYAQILIVLVPIALYRSWDEHSRLLKVCAVYSLSVIGLATLFTYSRAAIVVLFLLVSVAALQRRVRPRYVLVTFLVAVPLLLKSPVGVEGRLATLSQLVPGAEDNLAKRDSSFQHRFLYMETAWEMFSERPFLGVGAGNYSEYYPIYSRRIGSVMSSYDDFGERRYPHSLYLEVAAELGIVGIGLLAAILLLSLFYLYGSYRIFRVRGESQSASVAFSLGLGLSGYLMTSLFLHGHYVRYLWLLAGIAAAVRQIALQDPSPKSKVLTNNGGAQ